MLVGYARTSSEDQVFGLEGQIAELQAAGAVAVFSERVSSMSTREQLDLALSHMVPGDKLIVCKLDRLARSVFGLWKIIEELEQKNCGLRILSFGGETVDTRSATGKLILTIFAGFAQFEREMMLERQKVGIAKAKAEGRYRGRAPTVKARADEILAMKSKKWSVTKIAKEMGVCRGSVYNALAEAQR
jgi:DNA invertase Pin-like site-specific DNA recombinase